MRVLPLLALALLVLAIAPPASAELTISIDQATGYTVYADGAVSLAAPHNTTIDVLNRGYSITWTAPTGLSTDPIGYTLYRVAGPGNSAAVKVYDVGLATSFRDSGADHDHTWVYFVTATYSGTTSGESIPGPPVTNIDTNYPRCAVVSVYQAPPYYDTHIGCIFP